MAPIHNHNHYYNNIITGTILIIISIIYNNKHKEINIDEEEKLNVYMMN
jgi:hypothetical protein